MITMKLADLCNLEADLGRHTNFNLTKLDRFVALGCKTQRDRATITNAVHHHRVASRNVLQFVASYKNGWDELNIKLEMI